MSLPTLSWRQLPTQVISTGDATHASTANAIYSAFTSTTYADGSNRTPGSGFAWTAGRYQNAGVTEAVYLSPVSSSLTQRVIFAGAASSSGLTPLMGFVSTFVAGTTYVAVAKNAGSYSSWSSSTPFTTGQFSGYAGLVLRTSAYSTKVRCYESSDAVLVTFEQNSSIYGAGIAGAWLDPESADTVNDAESDGRLYGVSVTGTGGTPLATIYSPAAGGTGSASLFQCPTSSGNTYNKSYCFSPGTGTILPVASQFAYANPGTTFQSRSGSNIKSPILVGYYNNGNGLSPSPAVPSTFIGRVREIWIAMGGQNGALLRSAGSDVGYLIAPSSASSANQSLLLTV
jgi:hypothetical protein